MDAKGWQRDQACERYCCIWDRIPARLSTQVSYPTRIDGTLTTSFEDREDYEKTAETIRRKVRRESGNPVRSPSRFCGGLAAGRGSGRLGRFRGAVSLCDCLHDRLHVRPYQLRETVVKSCVNKCEFVSKVTLNRGLHKKGFIARPKIVPRLLEVPLALPSLDRHVTEFLNQISRAEGNQN